MRRYEERCYDCSPRGMCSRHQECLAHADANLASDIGAGWARFVWGEMDVRYPWPEYGGRCAAISEHLVRGLARTDERRLELARVCCWRAEIVWAALTGRSRDMPYRTPARDGRTYALPSAPHIVITFRSRERTRGRGNTQPLETEAIARARLRAGRFGEAQGLRSDASPPSHVGARARTRS